MARATSASLHLLTAKTQSEQLVVRRLREIGVRAYSPRYLIFRPGGPDEHPLFPGYVFVWVINQWRAILATQGVHRFLTNFVHPSIVTDLRAREGPTGYVRLGPRFADGQSVKIAETGAVGLCLGTDVRHNVRVLFKLLGQRVEMCIPERDLVAA